MAEMLHVLKKRLKGLVVLTILILTLLGGLSAQLDIIPAVKANIEYVNIDAMDDTRVVSDDPNANYGSDFDLDIGRRNGGYIETWLRFNLTEASMKIKYVALMLYPQTASGDPSSVPVHVYSTEVDWNGDDAGIGDEMTLAWNNKPPYLVNYTSSGFTGDELGDDGYMRIALNISDVEYWRKTNDKVISLSLRTPTQTTIGDIISFSSKEYGQNYEPQLEIVLASEGTESDSQVAVLVDSKEETYFEYYTKGVEKWLEWWKMDYEEIDIYKKEITQSLLRQYRLIVIPQFHLMLKGHLSSSELQAINQTVYEDGVGLVQLDANLTAYTHVWAGYSELFQVDIHGWVETTDKMNLSVANNTHFITKIYRNETEMKALWTEYESDLIFMNVTAGADADVLVVMPYNDKNYPAIIARTHGNGATVLSTFSTGREGSSYIGYGLYGFGERADDKTTSGMHGLLWRSMVWAAKKPFVFMGVPPFLTFRVDDIGHGGGQDPNNYIKKFIEYGFFVNLYVFQDVINSDLYQYRNDLTGYYWDGSVHISPHSWTHDHCIFYNCADETEFDNETLTTYFDILDAQYSNWNITASALWIPHFGHSGKNVLPFVNEREWKFASTPYRIPWTEGGMTGWLWESVPLNRVVAVDYADENDTLFCVYVDMPVGDASLAYQDFLLNVAEFGPNDNLTKATERMLSALEHGLADLFWGETFTHEPEATLLDSSQWNTVLAWVMGNISSQYPFTIKASKEYIARYIYNRRNLSTSFYDYSGNTLTLNFSGATTLPMAFYLFTDQKISSYSGILDYFRPYGEDGYLVWIPAYSSNHQVTITFGSSETNLPRTHYTTANVTSTSSSTSQLIINAQPIWKHTNPKYFFDINCTTLGEPWSVTVDGKLINYDYNTETKISSFNVTFSSLQEIQVSWTNEPRWQMTFNHIDLEGDIVDSRISWQLFKDSQLLDYTEGTYSLLDGIYTLKTFYHGRLINQSSLDTDVYGNSTVNILLQMKPHLSVTDGYIAFNNTIDSINIIRQTDENLTFVVEGLSPTLIVTDVPRNCTYIQRNDINQTGWVYIEDSLNHTYITTSQLSKWEYYFPLSNDTSPPDITIISPENRTYNADNVNLIYITDEPTVWAGYSLDGAENVTLTGNVSLSNLSEGPHILTIYANDTSSNMGFGSVSFTVDLVNASAHIYVEHTYIGDLNVTIGVGDPSSPTWSQVVWNRQGGSQNNLDLVLDISDQAQYLPPSDTYRWFVKVYDAAGGDQGQIVEFTITHEGIDYACEDTPVPVNDFETSHAYIPSIPPPPPPLATADIYIEHTYIGDLVVTIGVGDPSSPTWSQVVWNRQGESQNDLDLTIDLTAAASYLPPSDTYRWFVKVYDAAGGDQGQIVEFTITHEGQTYTSEDTPVPIYDRQTSYAYIPGATTGGAVLGQFTNLGWETREIRFSCARKIFYAQGRHWVFYGNHTSGNIEYRTSTDGLIFTSMTTLIAVNETFAIWNNDTHVAIAADALDDSVKFRMGTLNSDGTISWLNNWQTSLSETNMVMTRPDVSVDQYGHPWIIVNRLNTSDSSRDVYVTMLNWTDGTWQHASDFPTVISHSIHYHAYRGMLHELQDEGMYALWYVYNEDIRGRLYNYTSSNWETEEVSSDVAPKRLNAAVDSNNVIHIILAPHGSDGTTKIYYMNRTSSGFGTPIQIGVADTSPPYRGESITVHGTNLYLFWRSTSTTIMSKNYTNGQWHDSFVWKTTNSADVYCGMQTFYAAANNIIGVAWVEGTQNPYTLRYDFFYAET